MPRLIVSANYFDRGRKSPDRWLVRQVGQDTTLATAAPAIHALGITFGPSTVLEQGFGCGAVAFCETVAMTEGKIPSSAVPVTFIYSSFFDSSRRLVYGGDELHLTPDGKAFVVGPKYLSPDYRTLYAELRSAGEVPRPVAA